MGGVLQDLEAWVLGRQRREAWATLRLSEAARKLPTITATVRGLVISSQQSLGAVIESFAPKDRRIQAAVFAGAGSAAWT